MDGLVHIFRCLGLRAIACIVLGYLAQHKTKVEEVRAEIKHALSPALHSLKAHVADRGLSGPAESEEGENRRLEQSGVNIAERASDPVLQATAVHSHFPAAGLNFDGVGSIGRAVSHTNGAVRA